MFLISAAADDNYAETYSGGLFIFLIDDVFL
jgi:hypothetical protein